MKRSTSRTPVATALPLGALTAPSLAWAEADHPMLSRDRDGLVLRPHLEFGVNTVAEQNLFWNFADTVAPTADFNPDGRWLEAYLKPGLTATQALGPGRALYGGLSLVASGISANELLSPIQFGQATRLVVINGTPNPIAGVTSPRLSDGLFIEYTRALTPSIYLAAGFSVSAPGPGVDSMVDVDAPYWTGGFLNVVASF